MIIIFNINFTNINTICILNHENNFKLDLLNLLNKNIDEIFYY
jgi:hypothetical protein